MVIFYDGAPITARVKTMLSYIKADNADRIVKHGLWANSRYLIHIVDMSA